MSELVKEIEEIGYSVNSKINYVYILKNVVNDKKYVGCTKKPYDRMKHHLSMLRSGNHINKKLQNDFDLYGENAFSFEIVDSSGSIEMFHAESSWMDFFNSYDENKGYNDKDKKVQRAIEKGTKSLIDGKKLRYMIKEKGYSYKDLAPYLNVTHSQMLSIMSSNSFYLTDLYKIARMIEISEEEVEKLIIC